VAEEGSAAWVHRVFHAGKEPCGVPQTRFFRGERLMLDGRKRKEENLVYRTTCPGPLYQDSGVACNATCMSWTLDDKIRELM